MDLGLKDKVVLVTGASTGIGFATAQSFLAEGARLAICSRSQAKLDAAVARLAAPPGAVLSVAADLSQAGAADQAVARTLEAFGRIDVLINNVGGPVPGPFSSIDDASWQRTVDLTLMSAIRTTRLVLPGMRERRWGRIINVSSYSIKAPIDGLMLSNSIRLAVLGWSKTLSNEVGRDNVLINTVCPGWTRTQRIQDVLDQRAKAGAIEKETVEEEITRTVPVQRMGEPREIADVVVFLASERASYVTGAALQVDGGVVPGYL